MSRTLQLALLCTEPEAIKRIRIAARLQAANGFDVRVSDQPSANADLVVLDARRPDFDALLSRYRRLGILLVQLDGDHEAVFSDHRIDPSQSIAAIQRALRDLLALASDRARARPARPPRMEPADEPLLVRLCRDEYLRQPNLELIHGDLRLLLLRQTSRIVGGSEAELNLAAARISQGGWSMQATTADPARLGPEARSGSLDGFLILAALATRKALPSMGRNQFHLTAWPDLTTCGDTAVVRLSALLINGRWTAAQLVERSGADPATVNATLWAMAASGLLETKQPLRPAQTRSVATPARSRLLGRLARHFGLGQMRAA